MSHTPHIKLTLSPNDQQQFKSLVRQYEKKELKKAIKSADAILKKYPNHGETLAMKALVVSTIDKKKKEAYQLARKAVRFDCTSAMTWHVLAIIYRSDRCYLEAMRCMQTALHFNSTDKQLLRELSGIQVQARDYASLFATRKTLLVAEPKQENNWLSFAVSAHLRGQYKTCLNTIDTFEDMREKQRKEDADRRAAAAEAAGKPATDPQVEKVDPFEQSELLLYKNQVIQESGDLKGALEHLNKIKPHVTDILGWRETRVSIFVKLGQWEDAEALYRELIDINPDQHEYHVGLQKAVLHLTDASFNASKSNLSDEQAAKLLALYNDLRTKHPRAALVQIYPLFLFSEQQSDLFKTYFAAHAKKQLEKGVPSFWNSIKPLYKSTKKVQAVEEWALSALKSLRSEHKLQSSDADSQPPSTELWLLLFIAQHFNKLQQFSAALEHVDAAVKHTPTCVDTYLVKARILKHAGSPQQAADLVNKAREMDLADRYLNNKATLYLLRAGKIEEAQKLINVFTKIEAETYNNVFEMQVSWYEQAEGEAWAAKAEFGRALKRFTDVEAHFQDFVEDQIDFHTYNIRKSVLRSYIQLLRFEDKIFGHEHFVKAAQAAVETYLRILDQPSKADLEELETAGMSEEDKKAYLAKKKRQQNKEKARQQGTTTAPPKPYKKCYGDRIDWDPEGERLLKAASLQKCTHFVSLLQQFASNSLRTQLLCCDVYLRREKFLLALRCLKKAAQFAGGVSHPGVHAALAKFLHLVQSKAASLNVVVKQVVDTELSDLLGGQVLPAVEFNEKYIATKGKDDFAARFAAVKVAVVTLGQKNDQQKARLLDLNGLSGYPLDALLEAYLFLQHNFPKADVETFKNSAHAKYPLIDAFAPPAAAEGAAAVPQDAADGEDPSAKSS